MPLDQMHSANPPSHPELLAWLARDVADHGYDLRRLIRGLVLSEAYSRSSRWEGADPPRPSLFAVALVRPLTADATGDIASAGDGRPGEPARRLRLRAVREADPVAGGERHARCATSFATSGGDAQIGVAEALLFSNGKRITSELLGDRRRHAASTVSNKQPGRRMLSTSPSATCSHGPRMTTSFVS